MSQDSIMENVSIENHADGEKEASPDWSETKIMGTLHNYLTFLELQHGLAADYFYFRFIWYDLVPSLLLSLASSILALSTESFCAENRNFLIVIAAMTAVSTFYKGITTYAKYRTNYNMHKTVSMSLDDIKDSLGLLQIFHESPHHYSLEQRIIEALKNCDSKIPAKISSQFDALLARFPFSVELVQVELTSFDLSRSELWGLHMQELNRAIASHFLWPIVIPNRLELIPKSVSQQLALKIAVSERARCFQSLERGTGTNVEVHHMELAARHDREQQETIAA